MDAALATIPVDSPSDSRGPVPCADDPSVSSCRHELQYDETPPDGPGYFTRNGFLDYYGGVVGAARWDRAGSCDTDGNAGGSDGGAIAADVSDRYRVSPGHLGY